MRPESAKLAFLCVVQDDNYSVLTLSESINDKSKDEKRHKHDIEFIISGTNPAKALVSAEKTFYLIAFLVKFPVILPWVCSVALRRNNRSMVAKARVSYPSYALSMSSAVVSCVCPSRRRRSRPLGASPASPPEMRKPTATLSFAATT